MNVTLDQVRATVLEKIAAHMNVGHVKPIHLKLPITDYLDEEAAETLLDELADDLCVILEFDQTMTVNQLVDACFLQLTQDM